MVSINDYLVLSGILFILGIIGVLVRRNAIIILMSIELMLNAVNIAFIAFSRSLNNVDGHLFVIMIMTVAAAEAAVGLAIIVTIFRRSRTVNVDEINLLKG